MQVIPVTAVHRGFGTSEYDVIQTFVPLLMRERLQLTLAAPPGDDFAI